MARIRTVKPEHWSDKSLPTISLQAHLLWIGTWNFSDDKGVFENDPLLIKSQIFPRRTDIRTEQIEQWIGQLVTARYIIPFDYQGQGYFLNRTFEAHQRIDKPQKSKIPNEVLGMISERSQNDPITFAPYSRVEDSNVREGRVADKPPPRPKFSAPGQPDLVECFIDLGLDDFTAQGQAAKFLAYYESNGWKVGKNPMKDWRAAARNWKERIGEFKNQTNGSHQSGSNKSRRQSNTSDFIETASVEFDALARRK